MSNFDYDLFVIGAGSGGVRAARMAAGSRASGTQCQRAARSGERCRPFQIW